MTDGLYFHRTGRLAGMNENSCTVELPSGASDAKSVCGRVHEVANVLQVQTADDAVHRFAGKTASGGADALITVSVTNSTAKVTVNCEKMVICSMLLKDLKTALSKA